MTPRCMLPATALLLSAVLSLPSVVRSQSATIGVYDASGFPACPLPAGQFFTVNVKLFHTAGPVKTAHFKLVPSCPGAVVFGPLEYDLTFPACITDGATMATLSGIAPETCTDYWGSFYFDVVGPAGETGIPMTDCDGYSMVGIDAIRMTDGPPCDDLGFAIGPYRPTPADGATDVPTNTVLTYVGPANGIQLSTEPLGYSPDDMICGISCILPGGPACSYPVDPGLLAPNTTYYWRASNWYPSHDWCDAMVSQVFTFTTGDGPVATESATWGRVKARYRN